MTISLVFTADSRLLSAHDCTRPETMSRYLLSTLLLISPAAFVSSANLTMRLLVSGAVQSYVNKLYSFGDNGHPCGVPILSAKGWERVIPTLTDWRRSSIKSSTQSHRAWGIPRTDSLLCSLAGVMVFKAELKSLNNKRA